MVLVFLCIVYYDLCVEYMCWDVIYGSVVSLNGSVNSVSVARVKLFNK
jgi:hypothetical protein